MIFEVAGDSIEEAKLDFEAFVVRIKYSLIIFFRLLFKIEE